MKFRRILAAVVSTAALVVVNVGMADSAAAKGTSWGADLKVETKTSGTSWG